MAIGITIKIVYFQQITVVKQCSSNSSGSDICRMFSPTDVRVIVHRARNLLVKGKNTNDAYATMEFGGEKYATNVVEKSVSPSWHQECQYQLPQGGVLHNAIVTIAVYNKHHGKLGLQNDDFIGIVKIPLGALDTNSGKEYKRWYSLEHKNPKKEKKERGDVEVGIKFISKERQSILPDKKSPKHLRNIKDKLGSKLRRRSEDEDSGFGCDSTSSSMKRGLSTADLHRTSSSASDSGPKRRLSLIGAGSAVSARGLVKLSNKIGLGGHKTKASSVEVLHNPEIKKVSSTSNLQRSGSSGSTLAMKKQHMRNRSMPDSSLLALTERNSPSNSICINGPHIYVSGTDSGNNSLTASVENLNQADSTEDIKHDETETLDQLHASHNDNFSNSKPLTPPEVKKSPLSILYKPKSYYRLDVKELCKVTPIPEDPTVTFQQMSRDELFNLCMKQHQMLANKNDQIKELEDYIDKLLVKVMVMTPQLLDCSKKTVKTKF